jgi:hypothetical protein
MMRAVLKSESRGSLAANDAVACRKSVNGRGNSYDSGD